MTAEEAMADALSKHPECSYADWTNGLAFPFIPTYVVNLWRNEECYLNDDPPKHVCEGYYKHAELADLKRR
jgi:hypothetical protein